MKLMAPGMLICTRFGLGVQDMRWFHHRLRLLEAITAPSLSAQTSQDFHWVIFVDPDLDLSVRRRLQKITVATPQAHVLESSAFKPGTAVDLVKRFGLSRDGYMLTARIDDDDAWSRDTVERVYSIAADWLVRYSGANHPGVGITFPAGYEWLISDTIDIDKRNLGKHVIRRQSLRPYFNPFLSLSCFVLSAIDTQATSISTSHSRLAASLTDLGLDVLTERDESRMWLYTRHKQADSAIQKSADEPKAVNLLELEQRFGISADLVTDYIANANSFGYVTAKRSIAKRTALRRELATVDQLHGSHAPESAEAKALQQQRAALEEELTRISRDMIEYI